MSLYLNRACHAVLALLSEGYPPLEGRSPTRYSPVCHSTNPLRDFRVRLACVRHAASVDSEPGSNSHVKFAVPLARRLRSSLRSQLFNASADDLALALFGTLIRLRFLPRILRNAFAFLRWAFT